MKTLRLVFACLLLVLVGCQAATPAAQTFTVRAAPQLEAQADLATTAHGVAQKVDQAGTPPHSSDSGFLVGATEVWKNQAGPGKTLDATAATVAQEEKKIADAKAKAEQDAEAEKQAHLAQLNELKKQNEDLAGQLKTERESSAKAISDLKDELKKLGESKASSDMWAKLWAILLVGSASTAAALWFSLTRKVAPLIAISAAGLAGVVVVRACAGDITIVVILAVVLAALYGLGMWAWEHRKFLTADKVASAQEDAIEKLPPSIEVPVAADKKITIPVGDAVKAAVCAAAGDAGVQPQLKDRLVAKGYSDASVRRSWQARQSLGEGGTSASAKAEATA